MREIGEIQLAAAPERALMSSVETGSSAPSKLLTPRDVAQVFQVSTKTVRNWRRDGRLPAGLEIAGVVRWHPDEIGAWIDAGGGK